MDAKTQDMIDELKRLMAAVDVPAWSSGHYKRVHCLREAAVNALPALIEEVEKGPKWIPVTQDLPPDARQEGRYSFTDSVLVVERDTDDQYVAFLWRTDGIAVKWESTGSEEIDVTHWQRLPLPPSTASEDAGEVK